MSVTESRRAIYLEDDPRDIQLVQYHLSRSDARIELDGVSSVSELQAALQTRRYDVACVDYNVPGTDAFSVFAHIREIDPDMPIVVVTGSVGEEAVVECMRAGASDLVHKDRLVRLVPALSRALRERARRLERDLTHRQLRETHHTLHALVSSSPIAVCTINADRTVGVVWNDAAERLFGWSADEVFGQPLPFVPEYRRSETDALLDRVLAGHSIIGREVTRVRRDGGPVDLRIDAAPLRDAEKAIVGVVAFMSDITEQKRREAQLEASRDELRAIFDGSPILQFALNTDGTVVELNRAFEDATGIPREELIGRPLPDSEAIELESRPAVKQALERANEGEPIDRLEIALHARSGEPLLVEATARRTRLFDHDALMGFAVDVTEQRSLQEQLLQSQKMEAVGRLAGGVAHDFNNILTAVNGYLHLATSIAEPGSKYASYLDRISEATARASRLTHQLLLFSRRAPAEVEPIDVNQTVEEMTRMLARMIGESIELDVSLSPESCVVRGDSGQLGQVIMNLVVNARDAMPDGGILRVSTSRGACTRSAHRCESDSRRCESGEHVVISVSDTGVGIDEKTMSRLFEPFFTTKGRDKGTGLGLPVAYGIVEQHGGRIEVRSRPGEGSTFEIYLPAETDPVCTSHERVARRVVSRRPEATVLIVEDDDAIREMEVTTLERSGYRVVAAGSIEGAKALAGRHDIDVVVTDVVLPDGSGTSLPAVLGLAVPFIYTSGYLEDRAELEFVRRSDSTFVQKPFSMDGLIDLIDSLLEGDTHESVSTHH